MTPFTRLLSGCAVLCAVTVASADIVAPGDVKIENLSIGSSLSGQPGDAATGRKVFADKKLGNCLACHVNSDMPEQLFHGEIGPALDGVASRWTPEQLRTIVANSKAVFTDNSIMPRFYSLDVGENVRKDLVGKTILSAQQVEDVVAYLATLK
ncbi:MAG: sulfur oxidation c-type cytochrome SoxX [Granulosicoccus sp.]|nr:sulfur oxidation c-type cytochrome SoxX [Granulosicoccus sp.]